MIALIRPIKLKIKSHTEFYTFSQCVFTSMNNSPILLNDILNIQDNSNVKIRFNLMFRDNWNPIEIFKNNDIDILLEGQYWNHKSKKYFKVGQVTIGFIRISRKDDLWLLFHIGRVTKDLNVLEGIGYEFQNLDEYSKYIGRVIIRYKNTSQTLIRNADSVIQDCQIVQILPDLFDNDLFPGYEHVHLNWVSLKRVITKESWKTALQNQKAVYLLTDTSNGKQYVGSAYGQDMLLGRWQAYVKNGHGGNIGLKRLPFSHIKQFFTYSILDIYKSSTDDQIIIDREQWWKQVLQSRQFGYNEN